MNRKVFISVLGTGFYSSCSYVKGDFISSETRFVQQATMETWMLLIGVWTMQSSFY